VNALTEENLTKTICIIWLQALSVVLLLCRSSYAGCPHAARMLQAAGEGAAMPKDHPAVVSASATAPNQTVGFMLGLLSSK
jgi:hypothetical protein